VRVLLIGALLLASCGGTPIRADYEEVPADGSVTPPRATGAEAEAFAREACAGAPYTYCVDAILSLLAIGRLRGALVAICDYGGGVGDIVLIDSEADGEDECSIGGEITASKVSKVVRLPE
jgi:hypothetical protein